MPSEKSSIEQQQAVELPRRQPKRIHSVPVRAQMEPITTSFTPLERRAGVIARDPQADDDDLAAGVVEARGENGAEGDLGATHSAMLLDQGQSSLAKLDFRSAFNAFTEVIRLEPQNAAPFLGRAEALMAMAGDAKLNAPSKELGRWRSAMNDCNMALALIPPNRRKSVSN